MPFAHDDIKALIIEDSKLDQIVLKKLLVNDGFNVAIASDGEEAIRKYNEHQPDIVFMDLNLPDINGYELTKIIKKMSNDNYVPVIFVTGTNDDESLGKCLESGGDDFIVKPIKKTILKAKTNSLLRVKKMHDELLVEKKIISRHHDAQLKDLHDAESVLYNLHKPRFHNPGNLDWTYVAQNVLSGDLLCSGINPSGNHIILIGDNTGHGLPATIGSIITSEIFYSMVNEGISIDLIIEEINKKLYYLLPKDRFLAAAIIEFSSDYSIMNVWNAALPSIIVTDSIGAVKEKISSMHLPLGVILMDASSIVPVQFKLNDGDRVYALSDGLIEVFNNSSEMFGEQRFIESIECNGSLEKRVIAISDDVKIFSDNAPPTDDVLLLEINCDSASIKKTEKNKISFNDLEPMNWQLSFDFCKDVICNSNPIPTIVQTMASIQGLGKHREKIFLILTEMYSNALEHGILNLDSAIKEEEDGFIKYYEMRQAKLDELEDGNIKIDINHLAEKDKGIVSLTMEDDGAGFDFTNVITSLAENKLKSGRGISLIRDLCRKCEYSNGGRILHVEYEWQAEKISKVA